MINLNNLTTELRNENTKNLDQMSPIEIVTAMNKDDANVLTAVEAVLPQVALAVEWVTESFRKGGRLFYTGAGTSGRLGVLDASECPPTFGVSANMVVGLIAGGDTALRNPIEGAEDSEEMGIEDLKQHHLSAQDIVIGIAASGRTPYVIGGLNYANSLGCHTVSITCNANSPMALAAQLAIEVIAGPEILTGSTRLKSGTCQKMILNMISTASMIQIGKAYENLMVDVVQSNKKLNVRAENIVMEATGLDREAARTAINLADGSVKTAIVMTLNNCDQDTALKLLEKANGHVRKTIQH